MVLNTDTHEPENLMDNDKVKITLVNAGLDFKYFEIMQKNAFEIIKNLQNKF